jgi:hypothetical protein
MQVAEGLIRLNGKPRFSVSGESHMGSPAWIIAPATPSFLPIALISAAPYSALMDYYW